MDWKNKLNFFVKKGFNNFSITCQVIIKLFKKEKKNISRITFTLANKLRQSQENLHVANKKG